MMKNSMNHTLSIPSMQELQKIWSSLSTADRVSILGHASEELSREDSARLMKILAALKISKNR